MNKETNEINLLIERNDSLLSEDNCDINSDNQATPITDEIKTQELIINERKKVAKFLFKIYVKLLVQYSLIGFFLCLGFYKNYDKIFFRNRLSTFLTIMFIILFIIYIGILLLKYKKNRCHCCIIFHIIIYIPFIIILCFLISYILPKDLILSFIFLFVLDIISVLLFLLIFKRNRGYGILLLSLVLNAIYLCVFSFVNQDFKHLLDYNCNFSIASTIILYILFFNNISKKKLDEDEGIVAVYFFNYSFFFLFSVPFFIAFISIILIPLSLALFLLILAVIIFFGAGFILIFLIIKIFFYFCCKSKKNKVNNLLKEFD